MSNKVSWFWIIFAGGWSQAVAADGNERIGQELIARHRSDEQKLVNALDNRKLWKDAGPRLNLSTPKPRESELLAYLKAAAALRSISASSILARRIAFSPYEGLAAKKKIPTEIRYPVYATLKSIGLPSVPALLNRLMTIDPDNRKQRLDVPGTAAMEYRLAWQCIADIYAEKAFFVRGVPMAVMRIGFEIEDIRKQTGSRNSIAEKRLERVIKDMQKTEEFLKKR